MTTTCRRPTKLSPETTYPGLHTSQLHDGSLLKQFHIHTHTHTHTEWNDDSVHTQNVSHANITLLSIAHLHLVVHFVSSFYSCTSWSICLCQRALVDATGQERAFLLKRPERKNEWVNLHLREKYFLLEESKKNQHNRKRNCRGN